MKLESIRVSAGKRKVLPALRLDIGRACDDRGPDLDHLRLLDRERNLGDLLGNVRDAPPLPAVSRLTLVCNTDRVCGREKANANGEFAFKALQSESRPQAYIRWKAAGS